MHTEENQLRSSELSLANNPLYEKSQYTDYDLKAVTQQLGKKRTSQNTEFDQAYQTFDHLNMIKPHLKMLENTERTPYENIRPRQ